MLLASTAIASAAVLLLTTNTATTQWQHQQKVLHSSSLRHGRHTNDLDINIEAAVQRFWNGNPFHLANHVVRSVLASGNVTGPLIQRTSSDTNDNAFFSNFYEGKVSSLIDLNQYAINDTVAFHRRRKKQSFGFILAYDGHDFCGWQRQTQNVRLPSAQEVIETIIETAYVENGRPDVRVSGRTDAGVHALGQIARVRILAKRSILNNTTTTTVVTSDDVFNEFNKAAQTSNYTWRCLSVVTVSDKFHPTFDSRSRSYAYILDAKAVEDLILEILSTTDTAVRSFKETERYQLLVYFQYLLNSSLKCLINKELDYYALSYGRVKTETTLCTLEHARVIIGNVVTFSSSTTKMDSTTILLFEFTGNRFLRRMVRILVGTCIYHAILRLAKNTPPLMRNVDELLHCNHPFVVDDDDYDTTLLDICTTSTRERSQHMVKVAPPDGLIFLGANMTKVQRA